MSVLVFENDMLVLVLEERSMLVVVLDECSMLVVVLDERDMLVKERVSESGYGLVVMKMVQLEESQSQ